MSQSRKRPQASCLALFLALLSLSSTQSPQATSVNACYPVCALGMCQLSQPLTCTQCDSGLILVGTTCIPGGFIPPVITYLRPTSSSTFTESKITPTTCQIGTTTPTQMLFAQVFGSTFSQRFNIQPSHSFVVVKFLVIVVSSTASGTSSSNLIKISASDALGVVQNVMILSPTNYTVSCTGFGSGLGVTYANMVLSFNSSVLAVQAQCLNCDQDQMLVTDFQVTFGGCDTSCSTCNGPLSTNCLSCSNLHIQLTNGVCQTCMTNFYNNPTLNACLACPIECIGCTWDPVKSLICTACNTNISTQSVTGTLCTLKYAVIQDSVAISFSSAIGWTSSSTSSTNLATKCGIYSVIGGIPTGTALVTYSKTFTSLAVHDQIYVYFTALLIGQQNGGLNTVTLSADGQSSSQTLSIQTPLVPNVQYALSNECGNTSPEFAAVLSFTFPHKLSSVTLTFSAQESYLSLRDLYIVTNNNTNVGNCFLQTATACTLCQNNFLLVNGMCQTCPPGFYLAAGICTICPIGCLACSALPAKTTPVCQSCQSPLTLNSEKTQCIDSTNSMYTQQLMLNFYPLVNNWTFYPLLQNKGTAVCGSSNIIGATQIQYKTLVISRLFNNLPAHTGATLFFQMFQIDDYDDKVYFTFNGKIIPYVPITTYGASMCGNSTYDSVSNIYLSDSSHTGSSLLFTININSMLRVGVNNVQLFLTGCSSCSNSFVYTPYVQTIYSVANPPVKGIEIKIAFNSPFQTPASLQNLFNFTLLPATSRLLQASVNNIPVQSVTSYGGNRQLRYLLELNRDLIQSKIQIVPNANGQLYSLNEGIPQSVSTTPQTVEITRYINVDTTSTSDRASMRNLRNFFTGCMALALAGGLISFFFGLSAAFDDFFILVQTVFVQIFINFENNSPGFRVPMEGFSTAQFMAWLPLSARQAFQSAILPSNLYQFNEPKYDQFFTDVFFFRTIYHVFMFLIAMLMLYFILNILRKVYKGQREGEKYTSFITHYYFTYGDKNLAFMDRVVRFAYFTICWCCMLQLHSFSNSPTGIHIANSITLFLTVLFVLGYPIGSTVYLWRKSKLLSGPSFSDRYGQLRVNPNFVSMHLARYLHLLNVSFIVVFNFSKSPLTPLIILLIMYAVRGIVIIVFDTLGMEQDFKHNVLFYTHYPKAYKYLTVIQCFLFCILNIIMLIMVGQQTSATDSSYFSLGYACSWLVVIMMVNGFIRLVWGLLRNVQFCHAQSRELKLSIQKRMGDEQDEIEEGEPITNTENALKSSKISQQLLRRDSQIANKY